MVIDSKHLANVVGGAPPPNAAGQAAVARAYNRLDEIKALRNEASRLWWTDNPNDRATAVFMLRQAGIPTN